ncbi:hypothetical protein FHG66_02070 [Rubellimicrobium rubrum]|uniref:Peptidase metallopeptidase domain-containing protein n=1 Tax=Rubellimicrobium rubrum TaxID=2585369 RepID=A0A5C4N122_9RHOB|nr:M10 family metallopeptidase [Rubellimicrobium rubrum]TNC52350.1 hypothetical protein FHG66_02070 [Rubellimicrobium rubrum]
MAGTADVTDAPDSNNVWLRTLMWDTRWSSPGDGTVISVYIAGTDGQEQVALPPFEPLTAVTALEPYPREVAAMRAAMASFEAVCNIDFRAVSSQADADIIWATVSNLDADGAGGIGYFPGDYYNRAVGDEQSLILMNGEAQSPSDDPAYLARGGAEWLVFIHELGHVVGLVHPHDGGDGTTVFPGVIPEVSETPGAFAMNQGIYTMMSYNDGWHTGPSGPSPDWAWGYQAGPMALDIAALQRMYGRNMSYHAGADTYELPEANRGGTYYLCLWDAGGTDRILGAEARANTIDLRAATLGFEEGGGGWVSHAKGIHGGFTIANGVVIENATGGSRADLIRGNGAANRLDGLGGMDTLLGGSGADDLRGGSGNDTLSGGTGDDMMRGGAGADHLRGDDGADDFVFTSVRDSVAGEGRDRIAGFAKGLDDIVLTAIDANGSGAGNGVFRLDAGGAFSRGEIRQSVTRDGDLLVEMNLDGDGQAEMSILLLGLTSRLSAADFAL